MTAREWLYNKAKEQGFDVTQQGLLFTALEVESLLHDYASEICRTQRESDKHCIDVIDDEWADNVAKMAVKDCISRNKLITEEK